MAVSSGPKITKDGLVLHLDAANFESFRGEPTTNLTRNVRNFTGSNYASSDEYSFDDGFLKKTYYGNIETPIGPGATLISVSGAYGYHSLNRWGTGGTGNHFISCYVKPLTTGTILTIGHLNSGIYRTDFNLDTNDIIFGAGVVTQSAFIEDVKGWPGWKRLGGKIHGYAGGWVGAIGYGGLYKYQGVEGDKPLYITGVQYETGSNFTAFVEGSRGTTVATGGGWADMTNNGNHGELINGTSYDSSSLGALNFDGIDDYVNLGSRTLTGPATFSIWLKTDQTSGDQVWFGLGSYDWSNSIGIMNYGNNLVLFGSSGFVILDNHLLIRNGNWVNVVITQTDSTNATITSYINGVFGTQQTNKTGISYSSTTNYIGMRFDNNVHFNGKISQVSIYNRALSETEIRKNYEATRARYGL